MKNLFLLLRFLFLDCKRIQHSFTIVRGIHWLCLSRLFVIVMDSIDAYGFWDLSMDAIERNKKWLLQIEEER